MFDKYDLMCLLNTQAAGNNVKKAATRAAFKNVN